MRSWYAGGRQHTWYLSEALSVAWQWSPREGGLGVTWRTWGGWSWSWDVVLHLGAVKVWVAWKPIPF
jgi:hypothetical protein